jgi:hypothetical protein
MVNWPGLIMTRLANAMICRNGKRLGPNYYSEAPLVCAEYHQKAWTEVGKDCPLQPVGRWLGSSADSTHIADRIAAWNVQHNWSITAQRSAIRPVPSFWR